MWEPSHRGSQPVSRGRRRRYFPQQGIHHLGGQEGVIEALGLAASLRRGDRRGVPQQLGQLVAPVQIALPQVASSPVQLQDGFAQVQRHQPLSGC